jgi:hypothetical protein
MKIYHAQAVGWASGTGTGIALFLLILELMERSWRPLGWITTVRFLWIIGIVY